MRQAPTLQPRPQEQYLCTEIAHKVRQIDWRIGKWWRMNSDSQVVQSELFRWTFVSLHLCWRNPNIFWRQHDTSESINRSWRRFLNFTPRYGKDLPGKCCMCAAPTVIFILTYQVQRSARAPTVFRELVAHFGLSFHHYYCLPGLLSYKAGKMVCNLPCRKQTILHNNFFFNGYSQTHRSLSSGLQQNKSTSTHTALELMIEQICIKL